MAFIPDQGLNQRRFSWRQGAVAAALVVALLFSEYQGPIAAIAFAVATVLVVFSLVLRTSEFRFPTACHWLVVVFVLGAASAVVSNLSGAQIISADLERDLGMSVSYILFFCAGTYFNRTQQSRSVLLLAIVSVGLIVSVVHLVRLVSVIATGVSDLYLLRLDAGRGSVTQFSAVCACILLAKYLKSKRDLMLVYVSLVIVSVSMIASLSRGLILFLVIFLVGIAGVVLTSRGQLAFSFFRGFASLAALSIGLMVIYSLLSILAPPAYEFVNDSFVSRVENSVTEVASTNLQTRDEITENYRAFEVDRVLDQFDSQSLFAQTLGQGWGSKVEFGFETASSQSSFSRTSASFFHNGYAYFLMKCGIVGLVCYVGFILHIAIRCCMRGSWGPSAAVRIQRTICVVACAALAVGTVTTGGLGFPAGYLGLILLLGGCCHVRLGTGLVVDGRDKSVLLGRHRVNSRSYVGEGMRIE